MKKNRPFSWAIAIVSLIAVGAILLQYAPSLGLLPAPPTAQPTRTALTVTGTPDLCSPESVQAPALEFNAMAREFDDIFAIVQNTPAQDLIPLITEMQRVRRASEDFVLPDCMLALKELQVGYMNTFIETVLNLYSFVAFNPDVTLDTLPEERVALVNEGVAQGIDLRNQYLLELARLLGTTLEVPTSAFQDPSGPEPTTATPTP